MPIPNPQGPPPTYIPFQHRKKEKKKEERHEGKKKQEGERERREIKGRQDELRDGWLSLASQGCNWPSVHDEIVPSQLRVLFERAVPSSLNITQLRGHVLAGSEELTLGLFEIGGALMVGPISVTGNLGVIRREGAVVRWKLLELGCRPVLRRHRRLCSGGSLDAYAWVDMDVESLAVDSSRLDALVAHCKRHSIVRG